MNCASNPIQRRSPASDLLICCLMIAVGLASRELLEAWPNFKPVGAICIFAGLLVSRFWMAVLVPPVMMAISDFGIGGAGFELLIAVQIALIANLGSFRLLRDCVTGERAGSQDGLAGRAVGQSAATLLLVGVGSVQFFLTTNFAVWVTTSWYAPDLAGLASCYVAAIPFFWNTLGGDMVFAGVPLLAFQIARSISASRKIRLAGQLAN